MVGGWERGNRKVAARGSGTRNFRSSGLSFAARDVASIMFFFFFTLSFLFVLFPPLPLKERSFCRCIDTLVLKDLKATATITKIPVKIREVEKKKRKRRCWEPESSERYRVLSFEIYKFLNRQLE